MNMRRRPALLAACVLLLSACVAGAFADTPHQTFTNRPAKHVAPPEFADTFYTKCAPLKPRLRVHMRGEG